LLSPRSVQPEDTVIATAVVEGVAPAGDIPSMRWTADGGEFLENDVVSVDWVAPQTTGVFRLKCEATSGESSSEYSINVLVGEPTVSVTANAGEIRLVSPSSFYYLHSVPEDANWDSSTVYVKGAGDPAPVVTSNRVGAEFAFSSGLQRAAYVVNTTGTQSYTLQPLNIFVAELNAGTHRMITTDRAAGNLRRYQFRYPYFSADENWLTYQGLRPDPLTGGIDTLDVYVYNLLTDEETIVTQTDVGTGNPRNLYPTFSSDFNWVVYVTDRAKRDQWDLYGRRIDAGDIADTTITLTTGGLIGISAISGLGRPLLRWNPTQPVLAVVGGNGSDGALHLVTTNPTGATTVDVRECGEEVKSVAWSNDGQTLAVAAVVPPEQGSGDDTDAIFTVTAAGVATRRHSALVGDAIVDLAWSPDDKFVVYRLIRIVDSWLELMDVDGGTTLTTPVSVTSSCDIGARGSYAAAMSTAPAWGTDNVLKYILFDTSLDPSGTPTIWSLDIANAVQP
jgi:Tol biopolymer transport system component